jgi:uncharacterized protein YneF (UPF0154 family)
MLNTLDILYITLSIFVAIIWTLLSIALFQVIKILWVFREITGYYYTLKKGLQAYEQIPQIISDRIKEALWQMAKKRKEKKS